MWLAVESPSLVASLGIVLAIFLEDKLAFLGVISVLMNMMSSTVACIDVFQNRFQLFFNLPRYFAEATSCPMSNATSLMSARILGMSS